jgi:DNA-binding NarL/FixJ family response regulator
MVAEQVRVSRERGIPAREGRERVVSGQAARAEQPPDLPLREARPDASPEGRRGTGIGVVVHGGDPVSRAGISSQLRMGGEFRLIDEVAADAEAVSIVIADQMDPEITVLIRSLRQRGISRIVLLATRIDDKSLLAAVEAGVCGVVRRHQATQHALGTAIRSAAADEGTLPPDLLGRLLAQVGQLQRQVLSPRGLTFAGLTEREIGVLRLLAEGLDTAEVGSRLFYSERTVKNIIHDVTSRLELRNRTHAVAYAIREGLI